jgi:hypothetical protein
MANVSGFIQTVEKGTRVGDASPVVVENPEEETYGRRAWRITSEFEHPSRSEVRKQKLEAILEEPAREDSTPEISSRSPPCIQSGGGRTRRDKPCPNGNQY